MTGLVLLHGIGMGSDSFDALAPLIDGPEIHALDLPGYGGEPPLPALTFPSLADWLAGKLDGLGLPAVDLFGHSIGGMIALELAATRPDRVRALVLCNTTPAFGGRDDSFKKDFLAKRLGPLDRGASMADLARQSVPHLVGKSASGEAREQAVAAMAKVPEATFRAILKCLVTFDRRDSLPDIKGPALVLAGSEDTNAPARTMKKMADRLPKARYAELSGGHLLPIEAPRAVATEVNSFRQNLGAEAA